MLKLFYHLRHNLVFQLLFYIGLTFLVSISTWAYFNIKYENSKARESIAAEADRFSNTIKLGAHYAMMINSRDDINMIINNISRQKGIASIRIYNKEGQIKFSNDKNDLNRKTNIRDEACFICHKSEPPKAFIDLSERTRILKNDSDKNFMGIISPIYNEPGCAGECHVHSQKKKVLGALDVVVSLEETENEVLRYEKSIIFLTMFIFIATSAVVFLVIYNLVNRPIKTLIDETKRIAKGKFDINNKDLANNLDTFNYMGQLVAAIHKMGRKISENQEELNRQRDEYQILFESAPCIITVQNRNYRLLRYNREFSYRFDPEPGDFCYHAYKGRNEKCIVCPVEKTFEDGEVHISEESGLYKDGTPAHWIVRSTPIKNAEGETVAAMEMCLDISHRKELEERLELSEKKYYAIFNNIPNPVFVLDVDTFEVLDCNRSVKTVYGYEKKEIIESSFLELFKDKPKESYRHKLSSQMVFNQAVHVKKGGKPLFVDIWVSPAEYPGQKVLLVTTSDITKRLEAEKQLSHASKMATLGEMATGVAHELNQPLTVIKTASAFFKRRFEKNGEAWDDNMKLMAEKVSTNVDRASKIINHMRQFARKTDITLEPVNVNDTLEKATEMFSQQLKIRGIYVVWELEEKLPLIMADPGRLEQVFVNLLLNARDAIEENMRRNPPDEPLPEKRISMITCSSDETVTVKICDSGIGIDPSISEKIFEPFFTTKEVGKGTGLGLSISYGIIKDFNGDIKAEPIDEGGTCFIMNFPVKST